MRDYFHSLWSVKRLLGLVVCAAAGCAALCSLSWRMVNDTPILLYLANLMVRWGAVPYRDFFDMNLPGSYWMFGWIIRTLGTSDLSVHAANLIVLASVSVLLFAVLSKPCAACAALGVGLGALRFFSGESAFTLQRELFALIPISVLLVLGLRRPLRGCGCQGAVAGALLAGLALIKPQLVLYGLPVAVLLGAECANGRQRIRLYAWMGVGGALPLFACWAWLVRSGAWPGFCEVVQYWTLYGQMTNGFGFVITGDRFYYILRGLMRMVCSPYSVVAGLSLFAGWQSGLLSRKHLWVWWGLLALTVIVPSLTGQFWGYHRLPFYYLSLCVSGYLLAGRGWATALAVLMVAFWVPFTGWRVWRETSVPSVISQKHGVPDAFARYLAANLRHGDRAQPVDWSCGAVQGMLAADALPATRFPYTFYFLHHVRHPLIQKIRKEFMNQLERNPPRFLLEATTVPLPTGIGTEERFEAFETWRAMHYRVAEAGEHYRIWEYQGK